MLKKWVTNKKNWVIKDP